VNSFLRAVSVGGKIQRPAPRLLAAIVCVAAEPGVSLGCMVVTVARFHEPMLPLKAVAPLNMPGMALLFLEIVLFGRFALPEAYHCLDEPVGRATNSRSACRGSGGLAKRKLDNSTSGAPGDDPRLDDPSLRRCKVHGV
jgi:hypothetical protein